MSDTVLDTRVEEKYRNEGQLSGISTYPHFMDEKIRIKKGEVTCLRSSVELFIQHFIKLTFIVLPADYKDTVTDTVFNYKSITVYSRAPQKKPDESFYCYSSKGTYVHKENTLWTILVSLQTSLKFIHLSTYLGGSLERC